jgi:AcrR family transcriptional regulator
MADVAARAGVAKTTLYRRWPSRNELVVDAVAALLGELELPDLGSLRADVESVVRQFAALLDRPETQTALMAVVAESTRDPGLRRRIREGIVDPHLRLMMRGHERAKARGELPSDAAGPGATIDLVFDVVAGAVVHRMLVSGEPVDEDWSERFTTLLLHGMTAYPSAPPRARTEPDQGKPERPRGHEERGGGGAGT